jgi:hypothetical protein
VEPNFLFEWELQKWLAGAMACFFQGQGVWYYRLLGQHSWEVLICVNGIAGPCSELVLTHGKKNWIGLVSSFHSKLNRRCLLWKWLFDIRLILFTGAAGVVFVWNSSLLSFYC